MIYDPWFDLPENQVLQAVCTRKLLRNVGIGGVIWGLLNVAFGIQAVQQAAINAGVLILGILMLGAGIQALKFPSLSALLTQTVVAVLLVAWNVGISALNAAAGEPFDIFSVVFPVLITVFFMKTYTRLSHLRELIDSLEPEKITATRKVCKALLKKKLEQEPFIVQTANRKCRAQLMDGRAFFIQRDLMRAFIAAPEALRNAITKPEAKAYAVSFNHPLGTVKYGFDKKNTEKLRTWLEAQEAAEVAACAEASPLECPEGSARSL
jgi:hypothetical protein